MPLAIDPSSPAIAVQTSTTTTTVTTASFTPPAGSLLLVRWGWNTLPGDSPTQPDITDSLGVPLTYTLLDWKSRQQGSPAVDGQAAHWWAKVTTSAAMTVTVTGHPGTGGNAGAVIVTVITGADLGNPIGVHNRNGSTSAASIVQSYTAQTTNGWGFIGVLDWSLQGAETAGTGCTLVNGGSANVGTDVTYGFLRRTLADDVSGQSNTLNVTLPGTSTHLSWVYAEVNPAAEASPPPQLPQHLLFELVAQKQQQVAESATTTPEQTLVGAGISNGGAFGAVIVTPGDVTITAIGITGAEALGSASLIQTIAPAGVGTAEAEGAAALGQGLVAVGIGTSEQSGASTVTPGTVTITATGISTAERVGVTAVNLNLTASGVPSGEASGQPALGQGLVAFGVTSGQLLGSGTVTPGTATVAPAGISSGELIGAAVATPGAVALSAAGITSLVAFGNAAAGQGLIAVGIASQESSGQLVVTVVAPPDQVNATSTVLLTASRTSAAAVTGQDNDATVTASRTSTAAVTAPTPSSPTLTAKSTSTPSVSDG